MGQPAPLPVVTPHRMRNGRYKWRLYVGDKLHAVGNNAWATPGAAMNDFMAIANSPRGFIMKTITVN